ncbi:pyridoxamine 5'-phosphate oxidase family protein [Streptomyces tailanensis]|uniref:pyridoxamine 5'-phosphate oxidase family protein n=1 Tax=Streptomyces tailanensis TaxID=2569858 RepID=UPI00122E8EF2|nr:TIGR03618 family F420-dependent PPOX class oxidoreductase [Streptomyces tailanensis]
MPSDVSSQISEHSAFWSEYHLCTLTTLRSDGSPHVVPVGVTVDADAGVARVITRKSSKKVANIQASRPGEARVAICQVDGGRWATLEGTAAVLTDAAAVDDAVARYADRYGRTPAPDPERVVIEIAIQRVMGLTALPRTSPGGSAS